MRTAVASPACFFAAPPPHYPVNGYNRVSGKGDSEVCIYARRLIFPGMAGFFFFAFGVVESRGVLYEGEEASGGGAMALWAFLPGAEHRDRSNGPARRLRGNPVRTVDGAVEGVHSGSVGLDSTTIRRNFLRMEEDAFIGMELINSTGSPLKGGVVELYTDGVKTGEISLDELGHGERREIKYPVDTGLRVGVYEGKAVLSAAGREAELRVPIEIVERPLPHRMPVVMKSRRGTAEQLKELGFTHKCFERAYSPHAVGEGGIDQERIWETGAPVPDVPEEALHILDEALASRLNIYLYPRATRWPMEEGRFNRMARDGTPVDYGRTGYNPCGLFEELQAFEYNVGASIAQAFHDYPAWDSAILVSEIRGVPCFHEHDYRAFREYAGIDIPDEIQDRHGVNYRRLARFPRDRIIPDDHPILTYYRWFWKEGDGWNQLRSELHRGLKSTGRQDLWTFYDPAVRAPSAWGSAGALDVISHWTYSYPNPESVGYNADRLFAMAKGAENPGQDVMKMTQIFWYRAHTTYEKEDAYQAAWEKQQPDARFITISPAHLSIAFWSKVSRPVTGIMYHGLGSLIPQDPPGGYRHTHPGAKPTLRNLIRNVVEPLGPTLVQVPDPETNIAFLKSFTSEMFGGTRWTDADAYYILRYAQLQPEILYEETLLEKGLGGFDVLFMPGCEVLTESVVREVTEFQNRGGIVVGDENPVPALMPDITLPTPPRPRFLPQADVDVAAMLEKAARLREQLDLHVERMSDSDTPVVLTRVRRYGSTDYLFAYNDGRQFGRYVGHHKRVLEDGVPVSATVKLRRGEGYVYDLLANREVAAESEGGWLKISRDFEAAEGRVWMVTDRPVREVTLDVPARASAGERIQIGITVADGGGAALDAVVPVKVEIRDAEGREMEFSGYYGAADGQVAITFDIAENDRPGAWAVRARELASGITAESEIAVESR